MRFALSFLLSIVSIPCLAQEPRMEIMFQQVFNPLRQQITTSYPIASLRQKFTEAVQDPTVTLSLAQKNSNVGGHGIGTDTPLAFSGPRPNVFQPAVIIVFENFVDRIKYANSTKSQKEYVEYMEDLLLSVYLHEYYHIKKQNFWRLTNSNAEVVSFEADCWAYTVREILIPMQQGGRGKLLPGTFEETVLLKYKEIKGDTTNPRWKAFFQESYGKK